MTFTPEPAWGSILDVADGPTTRETADNNNQRGRDDGDRRGAR